MAVASGQRDRIVASSTRLTIGCGQGGIGRSDGASQIDPVGLSQLGRVLDLIPQPGTVLHVNAIALFVRVTVWITGAATGVRLMSSRRSNSSHCGIELEDGVGSRGRHNELNVGPIQNSQIHLIEIALPSHVTVNSFGI